MSNSKRGIVYVATGDKYVREAADSSATVREHAEKLPICLITDERPSYGEWDDVVVLERPTFSFEDKLEMLRAPYDAVLFLDTDTKVLGPLDEVFELLNRFDIALHQTPFGTWYDLPGVPKAFPEFNSGVIAFRKSAAVHEMFEYWAEDYRQIGMPEDQPGLRKAVFRSDVRYAWLPPEFNIMPYMPTRVNRPLFIAHGRAMLDQMVRETQTGWRADGGDIRADRAWVPRLGLIPTHNRATWPQLLRLWLRVSLMIGVEAAKRGLKVRPSAPTVRRVKQLFSFRADKQAVSNSSSHAYSPYR